MWTGPWKRQKQGWSATLWTVSRMDCARNEGFQFLGPLAGLVEVEAA